MDLYTKIIAESQEIMRVSCKILCKQRLCKYYLVFTVADLQTIPSPADTLHPS